VTPSGLFLSVQNNPTGSLVTGIQAAQFVYSSHGRPASRYAGTSLLHAHWLSKSTLANATHEAGAAAEMAAFFP